MIVRTLVLVTVLLACTGGTGLAQSAPGSAGAKKAAKCQQTIAKANAKFLAQRLKRLAACSAAALGCVQTAPDDATCVEKARGKCDKQLGPGGDADPLGVTLEAAVVKACGSLAAADLLDSAVLGFANAAATCGGVDVAPLANAADVARCLRRIHAGIAEESFGTEAPRASELTALVGLDAAVTPNLPIFVGCGACGTAPVATGKALTACGVAIAKAGAGFLASTRAGLDKCTAAFVKCAQEKPGDAGCREKAAATCRKVPTNLVKARAKLTAAIAKKCGGALPFASVAAAAGINLGALACACEQVGAAPVATLDDYAVCLARHHECALASLLPTVAPGLDGLLAAQNIAVGDLLCEPATASTLAVARASRAFTPPFGNIMKYMSGVFPAQLKTAKSPLSTRGTPPRVGAPTSSKCSPAPGRTCTFKLPISKKPTTTLKQAGRGLVEPPAMVIAVRRLDGQLVDDYFELPLGDTSVDGEVELEVTYADDLASCDFELALTVAEDGVVAPYTALPQEPHLPPANDGCANAQAFPSNPFFQVLDTTAAGVTDEDLTPSCAPGGVSRGVWYAYTPDVTGILTVSAVGSDFTPVVAIYTAGCRGTEVACVNEAATPGAVVQLPVTAGTPYFVHVAAAGDPAATSALHFGAVFTPLALGSPPTISQLVLGAAEVGSPPCAFGGPVGTAFPITITYADPTGNVKPNQSAPLAYLHFEPSQREEFGIYADAPVVGGDGFSGQVNFAVCALFGSDTVVSFKVNLATIGGLSNQLVGALPKPGGAN